MSWVINPIKLTNCSAKGTDCYRIHAKKDRYGVYFVPKWLQKRGEAARPSSLISMSKDEMVAQEGLPSASCRVERLTTKPSFFGDMAAKDQNAGVFLEYEETILASQPALDISHWAIRQGNRLTLHE